MKVHFRAQRSNQPQVPTRFLDIDEYPAAVPKNRNISALVKGLHQFPRVRPGQLHQIACKSYAAGQNEKLKTQSVDSAAHILVDISVVHKATQYPVY